LAEIPIVVLLGALVVVRRGVGVACECRAARAHFADLDACATKSPRTRVPQNDRLTGRRLGGEQKPVEDAKH